MKIYENTLSLPIKIGKVPLNPVVSSLAELVGSVPETGSEKEDDWEYFFKQETLHLDKLY
jgi:hypothetical protein